MKKFLLPLVVVSLAFPGLARAAQFEGTVNFKITPAKGQPQELRYNIKGEKMRLELPAQSGRSGGVIIDTKKRETTILIDEQKMYMVNAMPEPAAAAGGAAGGEQPTLEKTGEKEKILGYLAEKFVSSYQGQKTELWLAEGLGTFMSMAGNPMAGGRRGGPGAGAATQGWERALAGKELFPLRVISHDKDGKEFRMEVTAIDAKPLADAMFAPPADYQKFDMGAMMQGMGGLPGGMRLPGGR